MDSENEQKRIFLVPEVWLKSLLHDALDFEEAQKGYEFGDAKKDQIHQKAVRLMGYAKSAKYILDSKEHIFKKNEQ